MTLLRDVRRAVAWTWGKYACRFLGHRRSFRTWVYETPLRRIDDVVVDGERFEAAVNDPAESRRWVSTPFKWCPRCGARLLPEATK